MLRALVIAAELQPVVVWGLYADLQIQFVLYGRGRGLGDLSRRLRDGQDLRVRRFPALSLVWLVRPLALVALHVTQSL